MDEKITYYLKALPGFTELFESWHDPKTFEWHTKIQADESKLRMWLESALTDYTFYMEDKNK